MHLIMSIAESRVDASAESREDLRRRHKRVVLALLLFAAMLSVAIASLSPEWADLCMMNATERAAATAQWFYAAPLFMVSEAIIVLCLATHVLAGQEDSSDPYTHAYLSLCTLVAYQAFAGLIVFLKHVLADSLCNTVPNSVSGHTHFYIFYALTLPRLAVEGHKPRCRKHTAFWFMCYTSLVMLCVFQRLEVMLAPVVLESRAWERERNRQGASVCCDMSFSGRCWLHRMAQAGLTPHGRPHPPTHLPPTPTRL
eukprot:TRINITY_DN3091_c0_g1_i2.p1 TRINITY_DN3091_c0_g1~~TRINITY_DN3091_c0_g1_i2.p1  ORF type:complete len:255 (+),score=36.20 TRINITY_DN3091_c0_g1_i2:246-1010(+)